MDILITGSVAFDYLMTFPGKFEENILPDQLKHISLSFLVDTLVVRRGGIAPNIAYTLALLGGKPRVMATVGEDFGDYRAMLDELGVDTSEMKVVPGKHTASFFATTDQTNAQMASFYPGAMAHASELSLRNLDDRPDLVVISANDPGAMDQYVAECKELDIAYLYDPGQQVARVDGQTVWKNVEGAWALFVNDYEFNLVQKKAGVTAEQLLDMVELAVVTRGEDGLSIYVDGEEYEVAAVPAVDVQDPTGGGDAFRGGFLTAYSHGWDWQLCGQVGALAATYCLEAEGPQGQRYSTGEFITRFRQNFDDGGKLDILLKK